MFALIHFVNSCVKDKNVMINKKIDSTHTFSVTALSVCILDAYILFVCFKFWHHQKGGNCWEIYCLDFDECHVKLRLESWHPIFLVNCIVIDRAV